MACASECFRDLVAGWLGGGLEIRADNVHQAKRSSLPQVCTPSAFDEPPSGPPLAERDGVRKWSATANNRPWCFDVGTTIEQRIENLDIVTARCQ